MGVVSDRGCKVKEHARSMAKIVHSIATEGAYAGAWEETKLAARESRGFGYSACMNWG